MLQVYTLYNWKFETDRTGYSLYCVGDLYNGRGWETSSIVSMQTLRDGYEVTTRHSVYFLPW